MITALGLKPILDAERFDSNLQMSSALSGNPHAVGVKSVFQSIPKNILGCLGEPSRKLQSEIFFHFGIQVHLHMRGTSPRLV